VVKVFVKSLMRRSTSRYSLCLRRWLGEKSVRGISPAHLNFPRGEKRKKLPLMSSSFCLSRSRQGPNFSRSAWFQRIFPRASASIFLSLSRGGRLYQNRTSSATGFQGSPNAISKSTSKRTTRKHNHSYSRYQDRRSINSPSALTPPPSG
jgi:hypothetical protein